MSIEKSEELNKLSALERMAWYFFSAGFFSATWDRLLTCEFQNITLKIHYLFFVLSFLCLLYSGKKQFFQDAVKNLRTGFPLFFLILVAQFLLSIPRSYFPFKTFLYSCWITFDLVCIWLPAAILAEKVPVKSLLRLVAFTLIFHAVVIFIDQAAFYSGYRDGLIGFNQDHDLRWGVSRPAAFSFEPSYIASFLSLGALFLVPHLRRINKLFLIAFAITVPAIFFSTSRTGVGALFLGGIIFVMMEFWFKKKIPWKMMAVSLLFLVSVISLFYFSRPQVERAELDKQLMSSLIQGRDGSGVTRLQALGFAWKINSETGWLGAGLGASFRYWALGHDKTLLFDEGKDLQKSQFGNELIMSTWGQLLAEGGIVALILFLGAAFWVCVNLYLVRKKIDSPDITSALLVAIVLFFFILHWLGNVARVDIWVWYAAFAFIGKKYSLVQR